MNDLESPEERDADDIETGESPHGAPLSARALLMLVIVSGLIHFLGLSHPRQVVFDEIHFGKFTTAYAITHENFFDIHPPHAKLLIAGFAKLGGYSVPFDFKDIGEPYRTVPIFWFRLGPAIVGTLLAPVMFLLARKLGASLAAACFVGLAVAFENAIILQTRLVMLDGFLLFGQMGALASILASVDARGGFSRWLWAVASGALCGLAAGTKFTGLVALALVLIVIAARPGKDRSFARAFMTAILVVGAAIVVFLGGWWIHFHLLSHPGGGDDFYKNTGSFFTDAWGLEKKMLQVNAGMEQGHPYGSVWIGWPFMHRPILYWSNDTAANYLFGNPTVWWGSSLLLIVVLGNLALVKVTRLRILGEWSAAPPRLWIPALGYAMAFLPHAFIHRTLFLYHYFPALLFAILVVLLWLDHAGWCRPGSPRKQPWSYYGALAVVFAGFLLAAPFTFSWPVMPGYGARVFGIFPGWR